MRTWRASCPSMGAGGSSVSGNQGRIFMKLKPRSERKLHVDQVIQKFRPLLAQVPGIQAFPQNPPPIRIGGTLTKSLYQLTLQSPDTGGALRVRSQARGEAARAAHAPGRDERPPDQEPPGERGDRPGQGVGARHHRRPGGERALDGVQRPAGVDHLRPEQPVPGHHAGPAGVPAGPGRALAALYPLRERPARAAQQRVEAQPEPGPAVGEPPGPAARGHALVQYPARCLPGHRGRCREKDGPSGASRVDHHELPGNGPGFPVVHAGAGPAC